VKTGIIILLVFPLTAVAEAPARWGVNLYGLSHHFNRTRAHELHVDNEVNPGLGVRYRVPHSERISGFFDAGAYRDSGRNTALLAGGGAFFHLSEHWRLGGALAVLDSDTYNRGKTTIAPLPLAAFETRLVTLNAVYMPRVSEINEVATLGFWTTWWIR
jgi:hypothetical protein